MATCVFCAIVAGQATPAVVAWRDDETVVFPSLHQQPRNRGHMLVVPATHVADISDLDRFTFGALEVPLEERVAQGTRLREELELRP